MAEKFAGDLEWITTGGRLSVTRPDGGSVMTAPVYGAVYRDACMLGKAAAVDVEVRDFVPGAGRFDPKVLAVRKREGARRA